MYENLANSSKTVDICQMCYAIQKTFHICKASFIFNSNELIIEWKATVMTRVTNCSLQANRDIEHYSPFSICVCIRQNCEIARTLNWKDLMQCFDLQGLH